MKIQSFVYRITEGYINAPKSMLNRRNSLNAFLLRFEIYWATALNSFKANKDTYSYLY